MPPRYSYWTIIAGGLPTAFRAADREELLPTFTRIKHKHPDAQMKWFARGKLWDSPESAKRASEAVRRDRDWRPGGEHRDPRQKFKDAKKARNADQRKRKFDRRTSPGSDSGERQFRPHGSNPERRFNRPESRGPDRRWSKPHGGSDKRRFDGPQSGSGERRFDRPDRDRPRGPRTFQKKSFT